MEGEEILKNNKLIAEFVGFKLDDTGYYKIPDGYCWLPKRIWGGNRLPEYLLEFHKDWRWLMSVVEEIEYDCNTSVSITFEYCYITTGDSKFSKEFSEDSKLESTYRAVVEFIKYYTK